MAIQTLNTIKNWFKTGLKPSQVQFWDTWDSFRHKFEKVPVKDIDGIEELLLTKADKTILDNHLADKIAHAPQVNTDWNSESGFSQLINKPKFKTINGEAIVGDGDITISSAIPTLDQVLNSDNKSLTQPIVFLDEEYSATIDSKNLSIDGPLGEGIQYNGDNINWSKGDKNLKLLFDGESAGQNIFSFPEMPDSSTPYKLATDQVVSATQSGIVDTTSLQELGGADKLINGVRIGRGNNQDISNVVFASGYTNEVSTGLRSSALGFGTLNSNTTGNNNTAVGCNALTANTTGTSNTAVGRNALMSNTTASFNSAFGTQSLMFNTTGTLNMAFGSNALYNNTTGNNNVSAGASSLQTNTTGGYNTSLGAYSLYSSNGISNIAIGNMAGSTISTGNNNIIIGATSNSSLTPDSLTTGSNNLVIGPNQGLTSGITTGNGNVVLGKITGLPSDSENTISLSDGIGNVALRKETDNRLLAPGLTNALIDSGGAKSLVTKEYLDAHSGGSSQNLQQTLENGGSAEFSYNGGIQELSMFDGNGAIEFYTSGEDVESGESKTSDGVINKNNILLRHTYQNTGISRNAYLDISSGKVRLQEQNNGSDALLEFEDQTGSRSTFQIPNKNPSVDTTYKLATTDDIPTILPASATQSGIVDNTSLQELGGTDKLINGIRIGRGNNSTSNNSVALGSNALTSATTGTLNTAVGRSSMALLTTGAGNTAVGSTTLANLTTGTQNVAVGGSALRNLTTGSYNMAIGTNTLFNNLIGENNTSIGTASGMGILGSHNTSLGWRSYGGGTGGTTTGSGEFNIVVGAQAGYNLTTGNRNVLIETPASPSSSYTTGSDNIAINTGTRNNGISTGNGNTLIGGITGLNGNDSNLAIFANGVGDIAIRKEADNRLLAPTLTNALITSGGAKSLITKEYVDDSKQIKDKQIIINGDIDVQENWNGQTIIFKSSGIVRMPMITTEEFSFNAITLEGVNLTWQWANQIEWVFGEPEITPEKKYFNLTKLENTNQIILSV